MPAMKTAFHGQTLPHPIAPVNKRFLTPFCTPFCTRFLTPFCTLPWLRERQIPVTAYSPIEQARLVTNRPLAEFAQQHGMTPAQAALAWLLTTDDVIVIPKTGRQERLQENLGALDHRLTSSQLDELDRLFPPPTGPHPLETL